MVKSTYINANKIVLLGGTFDPIHNGHIQLAQKLYEVFQTPITFMPTGIPPHKPIPKITNQQRLDMLQLAIAHNPNFQIELMEIETNDFCYTYRTLNKLREKIGKELPVYFLIGGDSFYTLDTWDYWENILETTHFVIAWREGYNISKIKSEKLATIYKKNKVEKLSYIKTPHGRFYSLNFTPQNVSSSLIRERVLNGESIDDLVPNAVKDYIIKHKLYQN